MTLINAVHVEYLGRKPDCFSLSKPLASRKGYNWSKILLSSNLDKAGKMEIGLLLFTSEESPLLKMGLIRALFHLSRNTFVEIDELMIWVIGTTILWHANLRRLAGISSVPVALPSDIDFSCFKIYPSLTRGIWTYHFHPNRHYSNSGALCVES